MEIVVFTKRVPVTQEEELRILEDGTAVDAHFGIVADVNKLRDKLIETVNGS